MLKPLLTDLDELDVQFIITGSVAALAYGLHLQPQDIDLILQDDADNHRAFQRFIHAVGGRLPKDLSSGPISTSFGSIIAIPYGPKRFAECAEAAVIAEAWGIRFRLVHPNHLLRWWQELDRPSDWPRMEQLSGLRERIRRYAEPWPAEKYFDWSSPRPEKPPRKGRRRR